MKTHILGNGPSHNLYSPSDGYVIGCNFQSVPVDLSVVLDCRPFFSYKLNKDLLPTKRLVTDVLTIKFLEEQSIREEFEVVYTVSRKIGEYRSSGHVAVEYALEQGFDEIHLWGFDSIWEDAVTTKTDLIVDRSTRLPTPTWEYWRDNWKKYKEHNIIVHNTLEGTSLKELL